MGFKIAAVKGGGRFFRVHLVFLGSTQSCPEPFAYFYFDVKSLVGNEILHDVYVKSCSQYLTVLSQRG